RGWINHLNTLIIDFPRRQVERFEPLGAIPFDDLDAVVDDYVVEHVVHELGDDWKYVQPFMIMCPLEEAPQHLEATPPACKEKSGFCVTVAMLYAHMRILSPSVKPAEVVRQLAKLLNMTD